MYGLPVARAEKAGAPPSSFPRSGSGTGVIPSWYCAAPMTPFHSKVTRDWGRRLLSAGAISSIRSGGGRGRGHEIGDGGDLEGRRRIGNPERDPVHPRLEGRERGNLRCDQRGQGAEGQELPDDRQRPAIHLPGGLQETRAVKLYHSHRLQLLVVFRDGDLAAAVFKPEFHPTEGEGPNGRGHNAHGDCGLRKHGDFGPRRDDSPGKEALKGEGRRAATQRLFADDLWDREGFCRHPSPAGDADGQAAAARPERPPLSRGFCRGSALRPMPRRPVTSR